MALLPISNISFVQAKTNSYSPLGVSNKEIQCRKVSYAFEISHFLKHTISPAHSTRTLNEESSDWRRIRKAYFERINRMEQQLVSALRDSTTKQPFSPLMSISNLIDMNPCCFLWWMNEQLRSSCIIFLLHFGRSYGLIWSINRTKPFNG